MANPSSQRLNSPALLKDFQLVTCKGLEEKGQSQNIYWLEAMIYFCLISKGKLFMCSAFQPREIRSCVHRCCGHRHRPRCLRGRGACVETTPSFQPLITTARRQENSCSESSVQRETHRPKAVFLCCFAIANSFPEKGPQEWARAVPPGQGSRFVCLPNTSVGLSPLTPHSCTPCHLPSSSFLG